MHSHLCDSLKLPYCLLGNLNWIYIGCVTREAFFAVFAFRLVKHHKLNLKRRGNNFEKLLKFLEIKSCLSLLLLLSISICFQMSSSWTLDLVVKWEGDFRKKSLKKRNWRYENF